MCGGGGVVLGMKKVIIIFNKYFVIIICKVICGVLEIVWIGWGFRCGWFWAMRIIVGYGRDFGEDGESKVYIYKKCLEGDVGSVYR